MTKYNSSFLGQVAKLCVVVFSLRFHCIIVNGFSTTFPPHVSSSVTTIKNTIPSATNKNINYKRLEAALSAKKRIFFRKFFDKGQRISKEEIGDVDDDFLESSTETATSQTSSSSSSSNSSSTVASASTMKVQNINDNDNDKTLTDITTTTQVATKLLNKINEKLEIDITAAPNITVAPLEEETALITEIAKAEENVVLTNVPTNNEASSNEQEIVKQEKEKATTKVEADFDREGMRLGSFEAYVLVSVIAATSSYTTIQEFSLHESTATIQTALETFDSIVNASLDILILITASISTLSGMYATIAFSLSVLYGKTALGMGKYNRYQEFLSNTSMIRIRGFQAFCLSMLTFSLQVVFVVCDEAPEYARLPFLVMSIVAGVYVVADWRNLLDQASKIFLPEE